ncbi:sigma 54-interacting transcriptional regulator [Desulfotruncus arcticus]|uniref:sigma 54-interacting transcriptional regulator n=1 Tax=Desulfotruncus arcticus TaxID=341036 RepID=UPI000B867827|nr:sigma 54-interacting transcriptional regulator [Desulfotruncus arcticus]
MIIIIPEFNYSLEVVLVILPKIELISTNIELSKIAGELAKELGINLIINDYKNADITGMLKKWENGYAVEAVVTCENIADQLRGKTRLPVFTVQVSAYEVLIALSRAKEEGRKIILAELDYLSPRVDISGLASTLDLDVEPLLYREKDELIRRLNNMQGNIDALVSTTVSAVECAGEVGLPAFLIHCDQLLIKDALEKAVQITRISRRNVKLCKSLQAILENAYDGILAVDERGKVAIFNSVAERIIGLSTDAVLEQPISKVIESNYACKKIVGNGTATSGETVEFNGLTFTINRIPVTIYNQSGLVVTFQVTEKIKRIETSLRKEINHQGLIAHYRFSDIIGRSAMIEETIREARKYTRSDAAVLITGESGTGKELFAQSIHNESIRRNGPFVAINCAALPESLLESELFGYEEGAFTGAKKGGKQGLFAMAHGGTIFLDEIGDLSPTLQARLLRVLQQKEIMPVGSQRVIPVDVRVISATNRNLQEAVEKGEFRVDLYYRLNVLHLHIPSLRMRMEDLPLLFKHFYQRLIGSDHSQELHIVEKVLEEQKSYLWPGNIRELEGFVERYVALGEEDATTCKTLRSLLNKLKKNMPGESSLYDKHMLVIKLGSMEDMERQIIEQAAEVVEGGKGELAKVLGLSRTTLWKKLKKVDMTG